MVIIVYLHERKEKKVYANSGRNFQIKSITRQQLIDIYALQQVEYFILFLVNGHFSRFSFLLPYSPVLPPDSHSLSPRSISFIDSDRFLRCVNTCTHFMAATRTNK